MAANYTKNRDESLSLLKCLLDLRYRIGRRYWHNHCRAIQYGGQYAL